MERKWTERLDGTEITRTRTDYVYGKTTATEAKYCKVINMDERVAVANIALFCRND